MFIAIPITLLLIAIFTVLITISIVCIVARKKAGGTSHKQAIELKNYGQKNEHNM